MLYKLLISDVAVISQAEVNLDFGFNVLTGETGAGKSLIVDSLNFVLGERGSRELIRYGEKRAKVEALFCLDDETKTTLEAICGSIDGDELLLSRELFADGRNVCKINGSLTTVSGLKDIGNILVNIHGQHDGQRLLSKAHHRDYIDSYAANTKELENYKKLYSEITKAESELIKIKTDESEKMKRLDILNYWADEINNANLTEGEDETLTAKRQVMRNSEKLKSSVSIAYNILYGEDEAVCSTLSTAFSEIKKAADMDSSLSEILDSLSDALYKIEDCSRELADYGESLEYDPSQLSEVEERLDLIYKLRIKYGNTIEEIIKYGENAEKEASEIEMSTERAKELEAFIENKRAELSDAAEKLTKTREKAAGDMEKKVLSELSYLDMEKVKFSVSVKQTEYSSHGADDVEFLISTNPSQPLNSLAKIASGGEMSRICLAIKTVLSDSDNVTTMVFDEIDTGISGKAAEKAGRKMKQLGGRRQVICITHLPQIAALADNHYLIKKTLSGKTFMADVQLLDIDGRTKEVARIISGESISENAIKTAHEMIENS